MHIVVLSNGVFQPAYHHIVADHAEEIALIDRQVSAWQQNAEDAGLENVEVRVIIDQAEYESLKATVGASIEEVAAYADELVGRRYKIAEQLELLEDPSSPESKEMIAFKRAVKAKAAEIKAMEIIPLDFRDQFGT